MRFEPNTAIHCWLEDFYECLEFLHEEGLEWWNGKSLVDSKIASNILKNIQSNNASRVGVKQYDIYFHINSNQSNSWVSNWSRTDYFGQKVIEFQNLKNKYRNFPTDDYLAVLDTM